MRTKELRSLIATVGMENLRPAIERVIGLRDDDGARIYKDGKPSFESHNRIHPKEFRLRDLAEALDLLPAFRDVQESAIPVTASLFSNISGLVGTVGALIERTILESYQRPDYIVSDMFPIMPTNVLGATKGIGVSAIGDVAKERPEGADTASTTIAERYVLYPATKEYACSIALTFESFINDLTGELVEKANQVGESIKYRKELRCVATALGLTFRGENFNTYNYKDVGYNTYLTSGPYVNDLVNPLVDWRDVNEILTAFSRMTDPETNLPIMVNGNQFVTSPANYLNARKVFRDTTVETRTPTTMANVSSGDNPVAGLADPKASSIFRAVAKESGMTDEQADGVYLMGDFAKAFGYREVFPLRVATALTQTDTMLSQNVFAKIFARERGCPVVKDPRYVIRNKAS